MAGVSMTTWGLAATASARVFITSTGAMPAAGCEAAPFGGEAWGWRDSSLSACASARVTGVEGWPACVAAACWACRCFCICG